MRNISGLSNWMMSVATLSFGASPVEVAPGRVPMQYDIIRINAFKSGALTMRERFVERMTWFAEFAPNQETADYLWDVIMEARQFQVSSEDARGDEVR